MRACLLEFEKPNYAIYVGMWIGIYI